MHVNIIGPFKQCHNNSEKHIRLRVSLCLLKNVQQNKESSFTKAMKKNEHLKTQNEVREDTWLFRNVIRFLKLLLRSHALEMTKMHHITSIILCTTIISIILPSYFNQRYTVFRFLHAIHVQAAKQQLPLWTSSVNAIYF